MDTIKNTCRDEGLVKMGISSAPRFCSRKELVRIQIQDMYYLEILIEKKSNWEQLCGRD